MFSCCQRRAPGRGAPWPPGSSAPPASAHPRAGRGWVRPGGRRLLGASLGRLSEGVGGGRGDGKGVRRAGHILFGFPERCRAHGLAAYSPGLDTRGSLGTWPTPGPGPPGRSSRRRSSSTQTCPGYAPLRGEGQRTPLALYSLSPEVLNWQSLRSHRWRETFS